MKRNFLILLFSVITFCASSQVNLTDEQARFFLEQNEKAKQYEQIVITKDKRIALLEQKVVTLQFTIKTYESDSSSFRGIINTNGELLAFKDKQIATLNKEVRRQKRQKNMLVGAGAGAFVGSFVGPEGAVVGAVVGTGVGLVISWIKK